MPAKLILTTVAVAIIVLAGITAVDAGVNQVGQSESFTESFKATAGDIVELDQSNLDSVRYFYGSNVTVRNSSGFVMAPGTDYDWLRSNGTLRVLSGTRLDANTNEIDYGYRVTSDNVENVTGAIGSGLRVGTILVWALAVAFVVASVRVLGGI